ncbi:MAG: hypothetical protein FD163_2174 [Hyphomonadaceae bacterium]|nr:MAG: hypothetical protein FD128_2564 [Hyphomonadaceae bacterium]KAF0183454.1 MAG: hypothetical protein FD163_2174 [Hyphomonadaceae bacterium]
MRVFKSKRFAKFARKEQIADAVLCAAIGEIENGKIDADLGGGVIKQRIARPGAGKSGGFRSIILFRRGDRAFFVHCFAKSELANIDLALERDFKDLAKLLFSYSEEQIEILLENEKFIEVKCDGENKIL